MKIILVSFSGGRTSGYMTWVLLRKYKAVWNEKLSRHIGIDPEDGKIVHIIIIFANTSKERPETLDFVRDCDLHFGFHTIWVEAIVYPKRGKGNGAKVVSYETALRNGEVFEAMIAKHGIPHTATQHCTRELKARVIRAKMRDFGFKPKEYDTAIGYRVDEPKRWKSVKKRRIAKNNRHFFILVDEKPTTKQQINGWRALQKFNLMLDEHEGNCTFCYKKSEPKIIALICKAIFYNTEDLFWDQMEEKYKEYIPPGKLHNTKIKVPVRFYRGYQSYKMLREKAVALLKDVKTETELEVLLSALLNTSSKNESSCSESCEPFS